MTPAAPTGGLIDRDDRDTGYGNDNRGVGTAVGDAAITSAVKAKFLADTTVSGLKIDVDTKDGVVTLTGLASTDPEGQALTYTWVQTSGPAVTLDDANAAQPTFTAPEGLANTDVTFELVEAPLRLARASDCLAFERESFGALHQMLSGLEEAEKKAAWDEAFAELRRFEGPRGFEAPCVMALAVGTKHTLAGWRRESDSTKSSRRGLSGSIENPPPPIATM